LIKITAIPIHILQHHYNFFIRPLLAHKQPTKFQKKINETNSTTYCVKYQNELIQSIIT